MALISCPKCGREISDKAKKCPHCHTALAKGKAAEVVTLRFNVRIIAIVLFCVILLAVSGGALYLNSPEQRCIAMTKEMIDEKIEFLKMTYQSSPEDVEQFEFEIFAVRSSISGSIDYSVIGTDGEWCVLLDFDKETLEPHTLFLDRAKKY